MQPGTKAGLSIIGGAVGLAAVLCIIAANAGKGGPRSEPKGERKQKTQPERHAAQGKQEYPYPECETCLRWLLTNGGEPDTITILQWRLAQRYPDGTTIIMAKYRGKNQFGGWSVEKRRWSVKDGKVNWSNRVDNDQWPD